MEPDRISSSAERGSGTRNYREAARFALLLAGLTLWAPWRVYHQLRWGDLAVAVACGAVTFAVFALLTRLGEEPPPATAAWSRRFLRAALGIGAWFVFIELDARWVHPEKADPLDPAVAIAVTLLVAALYTWVPFDWRQSVLVGLRNTLRRRWRLR